MEIFYIFQEEKKMHCSQRFDFSTFHKILQSGIGVSALSKYVIYFVRGEKYYWTIDNLLPPENKRRLSFCEGDSHCLHHHSNHHHFHCHHHGYDHHNCHHHHRASILGNSVQWVYSWESIQAPSAFISAAANLQPSSPK